MLRITKLAIAKSQFEFRDLVSQPLHDRLMKQVLASLRSLDLAYSRPLLVQQVEARGESSEEGLESTDADIVPSNPIDQGIGTALISARSCVINCTDKLCLPL